MLGPVGIGVGLWGRGGVDAGADLLKASLFWGSSLDATSPDRTVDLLNTASYQELRRFTMTTGVAGPDGALTARRFVPAEYSGTGAFWLIWPQIVTSLTSGVRYVADMVMKPSAALEAIRSDRCLSSWTLGATHATTQQWAYGLNPQNGWSSFLPFPYRQIATKNKNRWQRYHTAALAGASNNHYWSPWIGGDAITVPAGVTEGVDIAEWKLYQSPLSTLPNRATGGATASVASETAAPILSRPEMDVDQTYYAWPGRKRCMQFDGVSGESVSISNAAALSGTDPDFSISLTIWPSKAPAADTTIWRAAGGTAALQLVHLTTGMIQLRRTADDSTTITAAFDRKLGTVAHALTIQVRSGSASVWSQGVQMGASKAFTSGKAATFTGSSTLGGSTWIGRVFEVAVAARSYSPAEISAMHVTLCSRAGLPSGARDTWFILGQSNASINPTDPGTCGTGYNMDGADAALDGKNGIHYEMAATLGRWPGWYSARFHNVDRRTTDGAPGQYDNSSRSFGLELSLHSARANLATIRYAIGGQPVSYFAPGGAGNAAMLADLDTAIADAGVPLRVMGGIFINGEKESSPYSANAYSNAMNSLIAELATRYGGGSFRAVVRLLPYYTYEHAAGVDEVRAEQQAWAAASPSTRKLFLMDDDYTGPPGGGAVLSNAEWWEFWPSVHGGTPQRWAEGIRVASVIGTF